MPGASQGSGCTFKALHGLTLSYLRDFLQLFLFVRSSRMGVVQVPLAKEYGLVVFRRCAFSVQAPALWTILPSEIRMSLTLLTFEKALKAWFCTKTGTLTG